MGQAGLGYADGNIDSSGEGYIDAVDAGILFANWAEGSGPTENVSMQPAIATPSTAQLVDAVLAAEQLGNSEEDETTAGAETTNYVEIKTLSEDSDETKTAEQPWLSDELLE